MEKKQIKILSYLSLISFALVMLGMTLVEVYSPYLSFLKIIGWLMAISGIVGMITMFVYSKIKKINLTESYKKEKNSLVLSFAFILVIIFCGFSLGIGKYNSPDVTLLRIPTYQVGFFIGFGSLFILILGFYNIIKKKRNI